MCKKLIILAILTLSVLPAFAQQTITRFAFVDADCKPGFAAIESGSAKHVISNVFAIEMEPAALLSAEESIGGQFRKAIDEAYPGSRNQFNGVYVYLFSDLNSAEQKREAKLAEYLSANVGLLDFQTANISIQPLP